MNKIGILTLGLALLLAGCSHAPAGKTRTDRRKAVNLIQGGGFEAPTDLWIYENRPESFERVPSGPLKKSRNAPKLGACTLKVKKYFHSGDNLDGPPYLIQTIRFQDKPAKVLFSADALFIGAEGTERDIRFNAADPDVRYINGRRFPYTWRRLTTPDRWQHFEWTADLSEIKNQAVSFGIMFSHQEGVCYLDNVKVIPIVAEGTEAKASPDRSGRSD